MEGSAAVLCDDVEKWLANRASIEFSDGLFGLHHQGSNDGENWADLRQHVADSTFHSPGQYASWSVKTETAYRLFRVLLTGPTTSSTSPLNMCLSNLELYGTLFCPNVC